MGHNGYMETGAHPKGFFVEKAYKETMEWDNYECRWAEGKYYRTFHYPERYVVNEVSVWPNLIPLMKTGHGCCNWSGGSKLKCWCGKVVGEMHLDCMELGVVKFIPKSTVRSYK